MSRKPASGGLPATSNRASPPPAPGNCTAGEAGGPRSCTRSDGATTRWCARPTRSTARARARGGSSSKTGSSPGNRGRRLAVGRPGLPRVRASGLPAGASFSWYTHSPARARYPYVRAVLLGPRAGARPAWAPQRRPAHPVRALWLNRVRSQLLGAPAGHIATPSAPGSKNCTENTPRVSLNLNLRPLQRRAPRHTKLRLRAKARAGGLRLPRVAADGAGSGPRTTDRRFRAAGPS